MNSETHHDPEWSLRPMRAITLLWRGILAAFLPLGAYFILASIGTPDSAEKADAVLGLVVLIGVALLGSAAIRISSLHVSAFEDRITVRKGIWRRPVVVPFAAMKRVVVHQVPSPDVVVYFGDQSITVANSLSEFLGPVPEVEIDEGSDAPSIGRMRRVARLIERRVRQPDRQQDGPGRTPGDPDGSLEKG
jgi:hypothetical protein